MIIDKLTALITWEVDADDLRDFSSQAQGVVDFGIKMAKAAAVAGTALAGLAGVFAKQTAENVKLAESVGISADSYLAWEGVMKSVGFEGEKVVDLVEEMNNKIGEMKGLGEMTAVKESLHQLGIEFKSIKDLAPEKQFLTILEAAKSLDDEQIAVSATDMLLGGEANRVVGVLRQYEGTVADILEHYRSLNFLTDEGVEGTKRFSEAFDNISTLFSSTLSQALGEVANEMQPLIESFFEWVRVNRELIAQRIHETAQKIADALRWVVRVGSKIKEVTDSLGGFANALKLAATAVIAWKAVGLLTSLSSILGGIDLLKDGVGFLGQAFSALGKIGIVGLFIAAALAVEDLIVFLNGGESAIDAWTQKAIPAVEDAMLGFFGVTNEGMTEMEKRMATAEFHNNLLEKIESLKNGFTNFFSFLVDDAEIAITKIVNFFTSAFDVIIRAFNSIKDLLGGTREIKKGVIGNYVNAFSGGGTVAVSDLSQGSATSTSSVSNKSSNTVNNVNVNPSVTVNAPNVTDPNQVARMVNKQIGVQVSAAVNNLNTGVKR